MTIKFMFNSPNDASLLYVCTEETGESPFGGEDTFKVEIRRSKEYSESILDDVKACVSGFTEYKYLGCRERIAREAYQLTISGITYKVFVFDKREENNIQLHIEIESPTIESPDFETRYLTIEAKHGEDVIAKTECTYHNGEGHEGEEGLCVSDSDSEYIDTEVHDFLEGLIDYIEEDLNPYVKQVAAMEYECGRYGGTSPVADFACQECGKDGVSITEDLLPIGKCCYCGYENEYYVCELCGTVYDDMGGDEHLCNGCMPRDD